MIYDAMKINNFYFCFTFSICGKLATKNGVNYRKMQGKKKQKKHNIFFLIMELIEKYSNFHVSFIIAFFLALSLAAS